MWLFGCFVCLLFRFVCGFRFWFWFWFWLVGIVFCSLCLLCCVIGVGSGCLWGFVSLLILVFNCCLLLLVGFVWFAGVFVLAVWFSFGLCLFRLHLLGVLFICSLDGFVWVWFYFVWLVVCWLSYLFGVLGLYLELFDLWLLVCDLFCCGWAWCCDFLCLDFDVWCWIGLVIGFICWFGFFSFGFDEFGVAIIGLFCVCWFGVYFSVCWCAFGWLCVFEIGFTVGCWGELFVFSWLFNLLVVVDFVLLFNLFVFCLRFFKVLCE